MLRRAALAVLLAAAAPAAAEESDHLSELDGLRAVHAWTRATDAAETLVFVEIENTGEAAVALDGARAEGLSAELVGFRLADGDPVYEPVPSVPVPAGRSLHLEPDGLAIRLTGLPRPLEEGGEMELELLTSLGALDVRVAVEAAGAATHSHAGHDH